MKQEKITETGGKQLRQLALSTLTQVQQQILRQGSQEEGSPISRFVTDLRQRLGCSESALWKGIKKLRSEGLLAEEPRIQLTDLGVFISEGMRDSVRVAFPQVREEQAQEVIII